MILILVMAFFMLGCRFSCNGMKEFFATKESCDACMKKGRTCQQCADREPPECQTCRTKTSTNFNFNRAYQDRLKRRNLNYQPAGDAGCPRMDAAGCYHPACCPMAHCKGKGANNACSR